MDGWLGFNGILVKVCVLYKCNTSHEMKLWLRYRCCMICCASKKRSKHGYVYFASFAKAYKIFYTSLTIQPAKIIHHAKSGLL